MYKKKQKNVKKSRKKFNTRIIKSRQTYTTEEIAALFDIHTNTVRLWYKSGLCKIDDQRPSLVFGKSLAEFIDKKNQSSKRPCAVHELFCCKCHKPSLPKDNLVCIEITQVRTNIMGFCATCGTKINKTISRQKIDFFKQTFIVQTVHTENLIECSNTCAISKKN